MTVCAMTIAHGRVEEPKVAEGTGSRERSGPRQARNDRRQAHAGVDRLRGQTTGKLVSASAIPSRIPRSRLKSVAEPETSSESSVTPRGLRNHRT